MPRTVKFLTKFSIPCFLFVLAITSLFASELKAQTDSPEAAAPAAAATEPNAIFPPVVAKVNGEEIPGRDLEDLIHQELSTIGNPAWKDLREDYRNQLTLSGLTQLINSLMLYQKAVASGIAVTESEVEAAIKTMADTFNSDAEMNAYLASRNMDRALLEKDLNKRLAVEKYIDEAINNKVTVEPEEAAEYYSSHPSEFQHSDIVRISHILLPAGNADQQDALAKQRAESLLERIRKGEDFAKLAKEYSTDASAAQGGDLGFSEKESMIPEFADAAFSLPVGSVRLVKTDYGYHIIKVTDRKEEGLSTLEEVRPQLIAFLKRRKAQEELVKLINALRNEGTVEVLIPAGQPINR
jgi:peptidyl-prolyl cis-trans isomerase C